MSSTTATNGPSSWPHAARVKLLIAAHTVAKLLDGRPGAVLVTFPTLGLLEQTYRTWKQQAPFAFAAIAVCSAHLRDTEDIHSHELSIASTTSPQRLLLLL
jgi:predicted helicase